MWWPELPDKQSVSSGSLCWLVLTMPPALREMFTTEKNHLIQVQLQHMNVPIFIQQPCSGELKILNAYLKCLFVWEHSSFPSLAVFVFSLSIMESEGTVLRKESSMWLDWAIFPLSLPQFSSLLDSCPSWLLSPGPRKVSTAIQGGQRDPGKARWIQTLELPLLILVRLCWMHFQLFSPSVAKWN